MADVLIVCVREDEPQAKALADMFEAAGFSIGGAPATDGALRSSGAGVIVWSRSSIRSRPFLDAAQRVVNGGKAVVASLIEPPPPESIGNSQAFDLSAWSGDANDPSLDPLFFAVDRMVNSARAAVGAGPAQPSAPMFEAPPNLRPPPAPMLDRRPPPPSSASLFQTRGAQRPPSDPLNSEAEHWRAIRDSRNPADFMDYLGRYGPDGAFSEVAELRLKQLTSDGRAGGPALHAAAARATERPQARGHEAPTPRRADAPPPRRPEAPRRESASDRHHDRSPHAAPEGASGGGGAMRTLFLVLLLGGAAAAAGLYYGNQQTAPPDAGAENAQASDPPADAPPIEEPASASSSNGIGLSELAAPQPAARTPARPPPQPALRQQAPSQQASASPARTPPAQRATPEPPTPTPVTSWGSSGPVSLASNTPPSTSAPGSGPMSLSGQRPNGQGASGPSVVVPLGPAINVASPPPPPATAVASVAWVQRPSARRISQVYPQRAIENGIGGRVVLDCTVAGDLTAACVVASETPAGAGFGRAALQAVTSYRAGPYLSDGSGAVGARTRVALSFQPPDN